MRCFYYFLIDLGVEEKFLIYRFLEDRGGRRKNLYFGYCICGKKGLIGLFGYLVFFILSFM